MLNATSVPVLRTRDHLTRPSFLRSTELHPYVVAPHTDPDLSEFQVLGPDGMPLDIEFSNATAARDYARDLSQAYLAGLAAADLDTTPAVWRRG